MPHITEAEPRDFYALDEFDETGKLVRTRLVARDTMDEHYDMHPFYIDVDVDADGNLIEADDALAHCEFYNTDLASPNKRSFETVEELLDAFYHQRIPPHLRSFGYASESNWKRASIELKCAIITSLDAVCVVYFGACGNHFRFDTKPISEVFGSRAVGIVYTKESYAEATDYERILAKARLRDMIREYDAYAHGWIWIVDQCDGDAYDCDRFVQSCEIGRLARTIAPELTPGRTYAVREIDEDELDRILNAPVGA